MNEEYAECPFCKEIIRVEDMKKIDNCPYCGQPLIIKKFYVVSKGKR